MLLSMTGYGEARYQSDALSVTVELRSVNNRFLKVSIRTPEAYSHLESEIEKVLRRVIRRGTVQVQLRIRRQQGPQDFALNLAAIRSYLAQLRGLQQELALAGELPLAQVLTLPGVAVEPERGEADPAENALVERVLEEALDRLQAMRAEEGRAMGQELLLIRDQIGRELDHVRVRAPQVVENYRDRLHERVGNLLAELDLEMDKGDLIKEVAVFAERSDIAEEIVRLASHLDQFQLILGEPESPGRKLEFLVQEMGREANTIGAKANDVEIARHVVEIKGALEKIRELIQNIE